MISKSNRLTFIKSDLIQYGYLLSDVEINKKVSSFLFKYISAEGLYKKLLTAKKEKDGQKLSDSDKRNLKVKIDEVYRVLEYFNIRYEKEMIDRLFKSDDKNYMECSIKCLRDRLVHKTNGNVLRAIIERYDVIENDLNSFFSLFDINL